MKYCVVVIWLLVIIFLLFQCFYSRAGIIVAVEYDYNDIIIEDMAGLVWVYGETEDWNCGDQVAMLMFNNFTPWSILDDLIIEIR